MIPQISVLFGIKHARGCFEFPASQADGDAGTANDVLDPLRFVKVLGEQVQSSAILDKPDFDLPWKSGLASCCRQVQLLDRKSVV